MVSRFPSSSCTKLCDHSHQKQQEQQNIWASLGHDLMKASLHCLAVSCCPWCLKQTCLPSKKDTVMQCLLHVGPSLTLGLFRKGFKMIIVQIMSNWALVHLSDCCSEVYWFCPILSFAHCFWWGCFSGLFSPSSCPPSVSLIPLCPQFYPTKPYTMPQPPGHWWAMTSVGGCQIPGSFLAGLCNVLLLFF